MGNNVKYGNDIDIAIRHIASLPGLGKRSAQRIVLSLLKGKNMELTTLISSLNNLKDKVITCNNCYNFDTNDPCSICLDSKRDNSILCVIEDVGDLWAIERVGNYQGLYHILGGLISPLDGIRVEDLNIAHLLKKVNNSDIKEVIFAFDATADGQSTVHYLMQAISKREDVIITKLSQGLPVGGDLDFLDQGTITAAMNGRRQIV